MIDKDILAQNENYRVYLVPDYDAEQPYDAGSPPIIRIDARRFAGANSVEFIDNSDRPHDSDDAIEYAILRWGVNPGNEEWRLVEKYMRAYFGTTKIDTYYSGENWYIAYDTEEWIRSIGYDDVTAPRADYSKLPEHDFLEEIRAWCEGETYGYVVEMREHVYQDQRIHGPGGTFRAESDEFDRWEQVDSCFGFYGYKWAEQAALEAYNYEISKSKES